MKNNLIALVLIAGVAIACNPSKKSTKNPSSDSLGSSAISQSIEDGKSFETAIVTKKRKRRECMPSTSGSGIIIRITR
jgi:hypothetical protein